MTDAEWIERVGPLPKPLQQAIARATDPEALLDEIERRVRDGMEEDLCPRCACRPVQVAGTGLCKVCHLRAMTQESVEMAAQIEAIQAHDAAKQQAHRARESAGLPQPRGTERREAAYTAIPAAVARGVIPEICLSVPTKNERENLRPGDFGKIAFRAEFGDSAMVWVVGLEMLVVAGRCLYGRALSDVPDLSVSAGQTLAFPARSLFGITPGAGGAPDTASRDRRATMEPQGEAGAEP